MAVRSYYCAICGIKLSPEQARYGRPSADSLNCYCPSCAEENKIECVRDAPPLSSSSNSSGRLTPVQSQSSDVRLAEPLVQARAFPLASSDEKPLVWAPPRRRSRMPLASAAIMVAIVAGYLKTRGGEAAPTPQTKAVQPPPPIRVEVQPKAPPAAPAPPPPKPAAPVPAGALIGNQSSKKVHRPECKFGREIAERNRVVLKDAAEALRQGFQPCKECMK